MGPELDNRTEEEINLVLANKSLSIINVIENEVENNGVDFIKNYNWMRLIFS